MSQPQQQQQSSFTYFAHPTNPIPSSALPFPQPPTYPPQPLLFPPGTEPYAQYTLTHVEYEAQFQFYEDPNVGSGSGTTTQAAPFAYDTSGLQSSVAALNSSGNNNKMNQGSVRCEVCNIECNTQDVYEKHLMGKKHQKNIQTKSNLATATFPETSNTTIFGVANVQELEKKKQKLLNAGAAVDSVRMCNICNVACNSYEAFSAHLSGKRHAAQAGLISINGIGPYLAAVRANDHFWDKGKKANNVHQLTWCEVCKTSYPSNDYAKHSSGKKHQKNLEKWKNGISNPSAINTPAATNLTIGPAENPAPKNSSGDNVQKSEDLETKKRKVMEGGAAVAAIRECTICNVVCNSETVFRYHLSGQKHAAMVKKQADARISATPTITTV